MQESKNIYYCGGFKYQLRKTAIFQTDIYHDNPIETELVSLDTNGVLTIEKYFAWDGCSGPTWDDKTNMAAGLLHDALYYLIRVKKLPQHYRSKADNQLWRRMVVDGACKIRASYYRWCVNKFGAPSADPKNAREVLVAPNK